MTANSKTETMFALVEQWKAGGQTKQIFCHDQGINAHTFSYWVTKYKQSQLSSPGGFTAIDLGGPVQAGQLSITYPNGVQINVAGANLPLIAQLIKLA